MGLYEVTRLSLAGGIARIINVTFFPYISSWFSKDLLTRALFFSRFMGEKLRLSGSLSFFWLT